MTVASRPPTRADIARAALDAHRARAPKLPLTWMGTGGKPAGEQGWQPHMWAHQAFASGVVFATAQALHVAMDKGVIDSPLPFGGPGLFVGATAAAVGAAGAAAGLIATAGEKFCDWARAYCTGGPAVAGAYLAAVSVTSPYSAGSLAALAAGTAVGTAMYAQMRIEQDAHELAYVARWAYPSTAAQPTESPVPAPPPVADEVDPEKRKWNAAFSRIGLKGCRMLKRVDTPAGYAILVGLPRSGAIGGAQVAAKLEHLERALGMLKDCLEYDVAVNRDGRELSDRCWIHVDVANILEQLLEMPDDEADHLPSSVNRAVRVGTFMDGTPMWLKFREISALIVGVRGRGKTNLFHVLVHRLSQCVDLVLWAIDLKGGRAVKPWLAPWLDDEATRPVFDWVATTRAEAALMIHAAHFLIQYRGKTSAGGSKITPTVDHPAVLILCDEIAALVGKQSGPTTPERGPRAWANPTANQVAKILTLVIQLGRSEAVDVILFTQRATVSMVGGGDLKSQCEMRIGLGVTNKGDASSVFQNNSINARKLSKLKHQKTRGACLIENGDSPNHLIGKTYFYGDGDDMVARIYRTAHLHSQYPADLPLREQRAIDDALLALTNGECGYGVGPDDANEQRWSLARAAHLYLDNLDPDWVDDDPGSDGVLGGQATPISGAGAGTATAVRPRSAAPAQRTRPASAPPATRPVVGPHPPTYQQAVPTSPGHPPLSGDKPPTVKGNKYYVPRSERAPGQPGTAAAGDVPSEEEQRHQADFDELVRFLAESPDAVEPDYDAADPAQRDRYEVLLQVIKDAGTDGIMAGGIMSRMIAQGRAWANRQEVHKALKRATGADGLVRQPNERGRYYWHEYAPKRPA